MNRENDDEPTGQRPPNGDGRMSGRGTGGDGDIIHRDPDAYEHEVQEDPEKVMFHVRPSPAAILSEFGMTVGIFLVLSYVIWGHFHEKTFFIYRYRWMLYVMTFSPVAVVSVLAMARALRRLSTRFEISRRFVRSKVGFFFDTIESCHMTSVIDVEMKHLGPLSNLLLLTHDKISPSIKMELVETELAKEVFGYVSAHANNRYVDLSNARRQ